MQDPGERNFLFWSSQGQRRPSLNKRRHHRTEPPRQIHGSSCSSTCHGSALLYIICLQKIQLSSRENWPLALRGNPTQGKMRTYFERPLCQQNTSINLEESSLTQRCLRLLTVTRDSRFVQEGSTHKSMPSTGLNIQDDDNLHRVKETVYKTSYYRHLQEPLLLFDAL